MSKLASKIIASLSADVGQVLEEDFLGPGLLLLRWHSWLHCIAACFTEGLRGLLPTGGAIWTLQGYLEV